MERLTISLDADLARDFDRVIAEKGYGNRSEALRDLIRAFLERSRQADESSPDCVANLSYVFNHHQRDLAERLTALGHRHHDLALATLHTHLDHEHCLESAMLRGPTAAVRAYAESLMAETGVRHGMLNLIAVEAREDRHSHGYVPRGLGHGHLHLKPKT
ncbi:MAG: nickel-responsive transcriptional regulator NikR [Rhodocyclaceae bacterium]|nr:nickel-responsive transcriptional regulator NikR [Rhodocyclaceae bacterium]